MFDYVSFTTNAHNEGGNSIEAAARRAQKEWQDAHPDRRITRVSVTYCSDVVTRPPFLMVIKHRKKR